MAGLGAVAATDPELIEHAIRENDDGTFTVTLGGEEYTVTAEFPDAGYADPTPGNQANTLWPALIEKALAVRGGGYENIESGNPGRMMELVTGETSTRTSITETTDLDTLWETLSTAVEDDHPVALSARDDGVLEPLHSDHAYTVLGVVEHDGERYVRVYNPWGVNDGSRTLDSMTHEIPLADVRTSCYRVLVNGS
jgi:hypothetical protein